MRWVHSVFFVLAVLELTMVVLLTRSAHIAWPPLRIAGLGLLILTVAWVGIARLQLGRSFPVTPQARKLITTGVYARIRNPIYFASPFHGTVVALAAVARRHSTTDRSCPPRGRGPSCHLRCGIRPLPRRDLVLATRAGRESAELLPGGRIRATQPAHLRLVPCATV